MYEKFIGKEVEIIVSTRGEQMLEYVGVLKNENTDSLLLENVTVAYLLTDAGKNSSMVSSKVFGGNAWIFKNDVSELSINKFYIISCNIK